MRGASIAAAASLVAFGVTGTPVARVPIREGSTEARTISVLATTSRPLVVEAPRHGLPSFIPADQVFFWTDLWQEGEAETDEDVEAGRVRGFDNVDDAIMWLLSPND